MLKLRQFKSELNKSIWITHKALWYKAGKKSKQMSKSIVKVFVQWYSFDTDLSIFSSHKWSEWEWSQEITCIEAYNVDY